MKVIIRNIVVSMLLLIGSLLISYFVDKYLRVQYSQYNIQLRLINHFLAGAVMPIIFNLNGFSFKESYIMYIVWSTYWEGSQFLNRGYFQYGQYSSDLMGVLVYFLVMKFIIRRDLNESRISRIN